MKRITIFLAILAVALVANSGFATAQSYEGYTYATSERGFYYRVNRAIETEPIDYPFTTGDEIKFVLEKSIQGWDINQFLEQEVTFLDIYVNGKWISSSSQEDLYTEYLAFFFYMVIDPVNSPNGNYYENNVDVISDLRIENDLAIFESSTDNGYYKLVYDKNTGVLSRYIDKTYGDDVSLTRFFVETVVQTRTSNTNFSGFAVFIALMVLPAVRHFKKRRPQ